MSGAEQEARHQRLDEVSHPRAVDIRNLHLRNHVGSANQQARRILAVEIR
jgi:hypothetical protein